MWVFLKNGWVKFKKYWVVYYCLKLHQVYKKTFSPVSNFDICIAMRDRTSFEGRGALKKRFGCLGHLSFG